MDNAVRAAGPMPHEMARHNKKKTNLKIASILVGVFAVIALVLSLWVILKPATLNIDSNRYQAVFLSNGQVYFGKITVLNDEYYRLNDIFYLQTKDTSENPQKTTDKTDSSDVELIKLGSEIHGPDDEMIISKDQVLFFENIKTDGTVTKSIEKYYSQN